MAGKLETFSDASWEKDVLASPVPVLVDFWAEWCAPCKTLVPILEQLAVRFEGRLRVGKLNVEENEQVPFQYNVTGLPTLLLFKAGQVKEQRKTLVSRDELVRIVTPHL